VSTLTYALKHRPPPEVLDRMFNRGDVVVASYSPNQTLNVTIDFFMRPHVTAEHLVSLLRKMLPGTTFVLYTRRARLQRVK
jgi:hypothetical protein